MRSIDIWRVEDAMFVEHWDELNLLEMFQQMGGQSAAADQHETPPNARALQRDWDRIIVPRTILQGLAVGALCVTLIS